MGTVIGERTGRVRALQAERLLALDTALVTGVAWTQDSCRQTRRSWVWRNPGQGLADRLVRFQDWLAETIERLEPELVVYEQPNLGQSMGFEAARQLLGYANAVEVAAWRAGLPALAVHNGTLKKHATGSGRAKKPDMIAAARQRGWTVRDDNEADALWLLDYLVVRIRGEQVLRLT